MCSYVRFINSIPQASRAAGKRRWGKVKNPLKSNARSSRLETSMNRVLKNVAAALPRNALGTDEPAIPVVSLRERDGARAAEAPGGSAVHWSWACRKVQ